MFRANSGGGLAGLLMVLVGECVRGCGRESHERDDRVDPLVVVALLIDCTALTCVSNPARLGRAGNGESETRMKFCFLFRKTAAPTSAMAAKFSSEFCGEGQLDFTAFLIFEASSFPSGW